MATQVAERRGRGKVRITFDVPPDLRRDVKIAAARRDTTIAEYVTSLILDDLSSEHGHANRRTDR